MVTLRTAASVVISLFFITVNASAATILTPAEYAALDSDADGVAEPLDNAPFHFNPGQGDLDGDGLGDGVDPDPLDPVNKAPSLALVGAQPYVIEQGDPLSFDVSATGVIFGLMFDMDFDGAFDDGIVSSPAGLISVSFSPALLNALGVDTIAGHSFGVRTFGGSLSATQLSKFQVVPQVTGVPEPTTLALFGIGAIGALGARRRR
jgi:hypothetical protein